MPRKPISRCGSRLKAQPLTFSPFGRSLARMASGSMVKHRYNTSKFEQKPHPDTKDNGIMENDLEEDNESYESSDEERPESESSDEEGHGSESSSDGVVQADFAFFDPKPDDFHGVKTLLQTYLDDKQWDLSGFVDLILGQPTVGTVIKLEDDDDNNIFSVITVLNFGRHKDHKCMKELKEFLLKVCQKIDLKDKLQFLLGEQAPYIGILVSQRVVNLPPQLLPPLYDGLFDEVSWATEDEPTEKLRKSFCFNHYLLISKIYMHKNAEGLGKSPSNDKEEAIIYIKPEDELFYKLCSWSFSFPLHTQQNGARELKNYKSMGLVMAIKSDKVSKFRKQLQSLINEP